MKQVLTSQAAMAALILLSALAILFLLLYLRERAHNRKYRRELHYIRERVHDIPLSQGNGYLLIPSEHPGVKAFAAELNRMLNAFYQERADHRLTRQAMAQMLTNISHDLRTPLTVLAGYGELLEKELAAASVSPDTQDMITNINQKTDELVHAIDEYFTLSKLESGDMPLTLQRTDLTALCHGILLDYYDLLENASFVVEPAVGSAPVYADTDPDALRRIVKNLIDNAIRHGGDGKYLGFRLIRRSDYITIEVEDHGPGIPEQKQEQIFSRNYSTAHRTSGSGLGLTITKNLASQMHADIRVMSAPGKTVFTLCIASEIMDKTLEKR